MRKALVFVIAMFSLTTGVRLRGATSTTGSISGSVIDTTGARLPGVTLTLSGPYLPQARIVTTDSRGEYRFVLVPPGERYSVEATLAGFANAGTRNLPVFLGKDAAVDLVMHPASSAEISVRAVPPLVDVINATSSTSVTLEQIEAFPSSRDFQQLTILAPQTQFDRDPMNPTVAGATHLENDYIIEGLSTRDPRFGNSATNLTMNFVEQVQVMTGGLTAEYGRAMGGVINVVTKPGGNDLRGDLSVWYNNSAWAAKGVTRAYRGSTFSDLGHNKRDTALSAGGPILRDRIWFFAAADPRIDVTPFRLTDAASGVVLRERTTAKERVYAAKVTAAISPSQTVIASGFGNPASDGGWMGGAKSDPTAALSTNYSGSRNLTARYDGTLGMRTSIEASAGAHRQHIFSRADTAIGRTVPNQFDVATFHSHGGIPALGTNRKMRNAFAVRVSHFLDRHEIRYGADFERNRFDSTESSDDFAFLGSSFVNDAVGAQDVLWEQIIDNSGYGTNTGSAVFAQDRWEPLPNISVSAGLRWEQQVLGSGHGALIATGQAADGTLISNSARHFAFDNNWAPRIAVSWDPAGRGRSRVYASAGRYFESIPVQINVDAMNGFAYNRRRYYSTTTHTLDNWWNPNGSPLNPTWILFSSDYFQYRSGNEIPTAIAAGTKLQCQDEVGTGAEYQVGRAWVVGTRIVGRRVGHVIEDHDVYGPNIALNRVGYIIDNIGSSQYSREFQRPRRKYTALELTVQRQLLERWQFVGSFVTARERGDYDGFYEYSNSWGSPNSTPYGEKPAWQENSYGRLRGDRPYQLKLHSSYLFPFGLTVSEGFVYSAGVPVSAFSARSLDGGLSSIYLLPRGSMGRTPNNGTFDLHAAQRVALPRAGRMGVSLVADVFNATNQHAALDVDQEYFSIGQPDYQQWIAPSNRDQLGNPKFNPNLSVSPYYKTATRFQQPRAVQLGLKLSY